MSRELTPPVRCHQTACSLSALLCAIAFFAPTRGATAQTTAHRIAHLWVDPKYGSDTAPNFNPSATTSCSASEVEPADVVNSNSDARFLLHDPWPFKTITAAVNAIPALPYTGLEYVWDYAIIHLMPGRYAKGTGNGIYPPNGLSANGETFPIRLPQRVSIQGASALSTHIDLEELDGPAFEFGVVVGGRAFNGQDTFIDKISIFGASRIGDIENPIAARLGSAIYIGPATASRPTITNCFLYGNQVAVCVDAPANASNAHHGTTLINNTLAWNRIGLWNGQAQITGPSIGVSKLILINNVFDSSPGSSVTTLPSNWVTFPAIANPPGAAILQSCFEGVALSSLAIQSPAPPTGIGPDFNAYEALRYNFLVGGVPMLSLPVTVPSSAGPTVPGVDTRPYTGGNASGMARGVLFVRDLFWNGPFNVSANFDSSPGDFRLAPAAAAATSSGTPLIPGSQGVLNPLVNRGWNGSFATGVTMQNQLSLSHPPGYLVLPSGDQSSWEFSAWEYDCEGYGNPRVWDHPRYQAPWHTVGVGGMDLGADELGELLVGGYRYGTTHLFSIPLLSQHLPVTASAMDNKYAWYFSVPHSLARGASAGNARPWHRVKILDTHQGNGWYSIWLFGGTTYYNPTVADISPHLVPDAHPWWFVIGSATNPVWQTCAPFSQNHNYFLYEDPGAPVINPPGSYAGWGPGGFLWLDGLGTPTFNLFLRNAAGGLATAGPPSFHRYDDWCRAYDTQVTTSRFDTMPATFTGGPGTIPVAKRYTIEFFQRTPWHAPSLAGSNLQSFLVLVEGVQ